VGHFSFHQNEEKVTVILKPGRYPHSVVGVFNDAAKSIGVIQIEGKSGRIGATIEELSAYLEKLGIRDAIVLDNGDDVRMSMKDPISNKFMSVTGNGIRNHHFGALGFGIL